MLLSLTRLKMADVDVDSFASISAIALTAVVGAVILLLIFLCNFVKKGFEKSEADTHGTPLTLTRQTLISHPISMMCDPTISLRVSPLFFTIHPRPHYQKY